MSWLPTLPPAYWHPDTPPIQVVDVGANPIDGTPPYLPLLAAGIAKVTGFEPNTEALAKLNAAKSDAETYIGKAVADEKTGVKLLHCFAPGMTSLFQLNQDVMQHFPAFLKWGEITRTEIVAAVALGDVVTSMDYLKIDVQGTELFVFQGAKHLLERALVVQTETMFVEMYEGQPLFAEQAQHLRRCGLQFHTFLGPVRRLVKPLGQDSSPFVEGNQWLQADAVFIPALETWGTLSTPALVKLAAILDLCYGSFDFALKALTLADQLFTRAGVKSDLAGPYRAELQRRFAGA